MFFEKRGGAPSWTPRLPLLQPRPLNEEDSPEPQTPSESADAKKQPFRSVCEPAGAGGSPPDGSLTSLGWLPNLKLLDLFSPEVRVRLHPPSPCSEEDACSSWETASSPSTSPKSDPLLCGASEPRGGPPSPLRQCLVHCGQFRAAPKRFRSDSTKPPFSFTSLVFLAIQHNRTGRASLHEICRWIRTHFKFFKEAEPGWQDSVRERLAVSDMFVKVGRVNGESSKGSCWALHPQLREILEKEQLPCGGGSRKLKRAYSYNGKESQQGRGRGRKRVKSEAQAPVDPCGLPGDLDWISLLSSQRVSCGSYGSPVLGPADLGQVGDPMICSPLIVPTSITSSGPPSPQTTTEPTFEDNLKEERELEDVFSNHNSPLRSSHLLPWAETQPESPSKHPWAESREITMKNVGRQQQHRAALPQLHHSASVWSHEPSCSSTSLSLTHSRHKPRSAESYIY